MEGWGVDCVIFFLDEAIGIRHVGPPLYLFFVMILLTCS